MLFIQFRTITVRNLFILLSVGILWSCNTSTQSPLDAIMSSDLSLIKQVADNIEKHEVQIIYTSIDRQESGIKLKRHTFNLDTTTYFYPASTVKMPVAFLALERIAELKKEGFDIDIHTPMFFDSIRAPQSVMRYDSCSPHSLPSVSSLAKQIFAISDNNAYNRLYEFLGQDYINEKLYEKKIFTNSHIITRVGVGGFNREENKYVNPIDFIQEKDTILHLEGRFSEYKIQHSIHNTIKGDAYMKNDGTIVKEAFDMSEKNFINLADLERSLMRFILPELFSENENYAINLEDREWLLSSMSNLPHDINCYADNEDYYDGYVKFFMYGDKKSDIPDHVTILNKVGVAYGYLTDCAYIRDEESGVEFFLSATIHVNDNKTYNDGIYEYDDVGIPFLAELGRQIYKHEKGGR